MSAIKERLAAVLDHLEGVGRYDKQHDKDASDCALWAIARAWDRDMHPGPELISRDVDEGLLGMMRQAYMAGFEAQDGVAA